MIETQELKREDLAQHVADMRIASEADPAYFVSNHLGDTLWSKQREIAMSVRNNPITTVRSCHGIGKSYTAARLAIWYLLNYDDSIVVTTAPTFRQVEQIIWREMRSAKKLAKLPIPGKMLKTRFDISEEWYALGLSSDDADKIQGFHPKSGHIFVIVDEAAGVDEDTYIAVESILSSMYARALFIGNPTALAGTFYKSHHQDPNAKKIHVSCFDTPNFTNNGIRNLEDLMAVDMSKIEIVAPYLITPQWVKDKVRKWGVDSPMFQARCLGNFPSAEVNTLIPLNVIEMAATPERKKALKAGDPFTGVDVARYGDDETVIAPRLGGIFEKLQVSNKEATTATTGRVKLLPAQSAIAVDSDGVGGPVADMLKEDGFDNIIEIYNNSTALPDNSGLKFVNLRSQMWWYAAERFKAGDVYIPEDDEELQSQLATPRYTITRQGIAVETKDEIKKRIKVSPDRADAVVYSLGADFLHAADQVQATVGRKYEDNQEKEW